MSTNQDTQEPILEGIAKNSFGDFYIESINKQTFKTNSITTVYDNFYASTFEQKETLYVLGGSDVGLLAKYLNQKYGQEPEGRKFIFIEFKTVMDSDAFKANTAELPKKQFRFMEPISDEVLKIRDESIEYFISRKVRLLKSLATIDRVESLYQELWKVLTEGYMQLQQQETYNFNKPFVEAQLKNLSGNIIPISKIQNTLKGKKAIVLGGGPSLDKCIDWIKKNREHFYIFSVGRIAARLLKEELIPDFFVSVDPHDVSYDNSKQMLLFAEQSILLNCFHVTPKLLNKWSGLSAYYDHRLPWKLEKNNSNSPGPTVVHSAIQQAVFLGCDEIYLAGVDMCFYRGQTHESGSAEQAYGKMAIKHLLQTETYSGELADTDLPFYQGVEGLRTLATGYAKFFNTKLFNLSEFAAKVDGIEYCAPENVFVVEKEQKTLRIATIREQLALNLQQYKEKLSVSLKEVQKERQFLIEQKKLMKKGADLAKKMVRQPKNEIKINEIKLKLEKKLDTQSVMLFQFGYGNFNKVMKPLEDEENMTIEEQQFFLKEYFLAMTKSTTEFIESLNETITTLQFRLFEIEESDLRLLLPKWQQRDEVGRHLFWKKIHSSDELIIDESDIWKQAEDAFKAEIELKDTQQALNLKKRSTDVSNIFAKLFKAFDEKNCAELESIKSLLEKKETSELNDQLITISEAMLCEFHNKDNLAVALYESIYHVNLKMFALKRILHFALEKKDHDKVLLTLQNLVPFSKEYLVNFADYMAILGQGEMALQVYQVYLQDKPENILVWVKLADIAKELNQATVFENSITQIKQLDANSRELKRLLA